MLLHCTAQSVRSAGVFLCAGQRSGTKKKKGGGEGRIRCTNPLLQKQETVETIFVNQSFLQYKHLEG